MASQVVLQLSLIMCLAPRQRQPRAGARGARARAALLALAAVALLLAQSGHWALVAHAYCATHGDLVHDDHEHRGEAEPDATPREGGDRAGAAHEATEREATRHAARAPDRGASPAWTAPTDHDEGHEHCTVAAHAGDLARVPPSLVEADLLAFVVAAGAPKTPSQARRLYLLAPKASPPPSMHACC